MLEIARLLSIIYEDDSTRPKVTVLFALMPADGFNYLASRDWLEAVEREDVVSLFGIYNLSSFKVPLRALTRLIWQFVSMVLD